MHSHLIQLGTTIGIISLTGLVGAGIGVGSAYWLYNTAANEKISEQQKYIHHDI